MCSKPSSVKRQILFLQAGGFALALHQEALGNLQFFLLGVAGDAQDFHAILQRLRNGVQHVGGADEHHFRKVVLHVEIMIGEGVIQFGIEHFHQRRRRIAAEVGGHFVHFIQNENRIDGAGLLHHLDDLAGQRADVGAAMAANFGFIANAARAKREQICVPWHGRWTSPARFCRRPEARQSRGSSPWDS